LHFSGDLKRCPDQLFLLLAEGQPLVHQAIERLQVAAQLLDPGFQRMQRGAFDSVLPQLRQQLVERADFYQYTMRPLVLLGLARHGQQRWRSSGYALGVTRQLLGLYDHGNAALRDQTERTVDLTE
jgi:hypothetical protein